MIKILFGLVILIGICHSFPISEDGENDSTLEEIGGNFEGDIVISNDQEQAIKEGRTSLLASSARWPNNVIPYEIDLTKFSANQLATIRRGIDTIQINSCLQFVPRSAKHVDYIRIAGENTGCWSKLGRVGGVQNVNIQPGGCTNIGIVMHELLHALGFVHTQSSSDRDYYVTINYQNIQAGQSHNFARYSSSVITDFGIPYDYDSVMHYSIYGFSNGNPSITPKDPSINPRELGQRSYLSPKDIKRLNMMYPNCGIV